MTTDDFRKLILSPKNAVLVALNGKQPIGSMDSKGAMNLYRTSVEVGDIGTKAINNFRYIQRKNILDYYLYKHIEHIIEE
jgi:hypothetical protein